MSRSKNVSMQNIADRMPNEALYLPDAFINNGPISAIIPQAGDIAELKFGRLFNQLPAEAVNHLKIKVMDKERPISSVSLKEGDNSVIVLHFEYPVYSKDSSGVQVFYDGNGGIQAAGGYAIPDFVYSVKNESTYQIETPWASQVDKNNVLPEYPRPQMVREKWLNLNGEWEFMTAKVGDALPTGQTLGEKIVVPFAVESKLSGIGRVESLMWYKRNFTVPSDWSAQRVQLNFGAVDYIATVYVNGQKVGTHKGGYTSFSFDITSYLTNGDNELIVHVLDQTDKAQELQAVGKQTVKKLGGIWYTSVSGIWQTVWMEPVSAAHIQKLDMVPDIQNQVLKIKAVAEGVQNETVQVIVKKGNEIIGTKIGNTGEEIPVPVPNARLWSPDDPFLYDLEVRLKSGNQTTDEVASYFGMREIKLGIVDGKLRPLLNGKFVFQMGVLDQGYWPDGLYTAPTDEALKFDIETVKRLDMNMIRKHIKVENARWYYWADKLGVLVWQDMPSFEGQAALNISQEAKSQWLSEYKEMVDQLRSVPSIIDWVVFNEGWGQFDRGGQETKDVTAYVKSLDPTRLVTSTSGSIDAGVGDFIDNHNYPSPKSSAPSSTRAAVNGEYGGLGLHVPGHEWSPKVFSYQLMDSKEAITNRYIEFINTIKSMRDDPGLSGAVYTQISDVEYEINGLLSYDRKVEKLDFDQIAKAHRELLKGNTPIQNRQ
jgi:hypothetical protein